MVWEEIMNEWKNYTVFPENVRCGPKGLGDPDDKSLRYVEKEIMIPKIMEAHVKKEYCKELIEVFQKCSVDHPFSFFVTCRKEVNAMKACMSSYYESPEYRAKCTEEYLEKRSDYRRTGVGITAESVLKRRARSEAFMRKLDAEDKAKQQKKQEEKK